MIISINSGSWGQVIVSRLFIDFGKSGTKKEGQEKV
jgi:hypothetical protein